MNIDPLTAHLSSDASRGGSHDDLVLACAVACWLGEREKAQGVLLESRSYVNVYP